MNPGTRTIAVPNAVIHYQMRGRGPLLLILQGGAGDADGSEALAELLAEDHTVLTYDRRGLSRSILRDPTQPITLELHADDVHRLLASLGVEPAIVFGCSMGAAIGLALVARHPEQVRVLVAHEPPLPELLTEPERAEVERVRRELEVTYREQGLPGAMRTFLAQTGVSFDDREPDVALPSPDPRRAANMRFFLEHDGPAVDAYRLELGALRAASTAIVAAGGETSRSCFPSQCALALSRALDIPFVEFPGGHSGYVLRPRAFAAALREAVARVSAAG